MEQDCYYPTRDEYLRGTALRLAIESLPDHLRSDVDVVLRNARCFRDFLRGPDECVVNSRDVSPEDFEAGMAMIHEALNVQGTPIATTEDDLAANPDTAVNEPQQVVATIGTGDTRSFAVT